MTNKFRLITIPISHYSEKARWAMDYLKIPFQEVAHMPPFHRGATKKYQGTSVPVLVTDDGAIDDSTKILRYLDTLYPGKLYPTEFQAQIEELEPLLNIKLGENTRRWGYSHILTPELVYPRWTQGVPFWQKLLFPVMFPKIKSRIQEMLVLNETSAAESYQEIVVVFDRINALLSDGRKYLLGNEFSALDITFAALAAPILQPLEQHIPPSSLDLLPIQMQADIRTCQATPAGELGLRLYRENRRYV
jgi:glutathione S-transferase